jgi:ACT domain-containing protein
MMMIVDLNASDKPFDELQKELTQIGEEIGVDIKCQKEEIFEMMHRI